MPATQYLFIDGAYLHARAESAGQAWFGKPIELDHATLSLSCSKTFYYDCLPSKTKQESDADFAARRGKQEALFKRLRTHKGWHVSEGLAKWRKGKGSSQKEVDILIAVDMLTHAHRHNMDSLIFIAGDQDFRPLVEAVVREGIFVTLWYEPSSISQELLDEADFGYRLGLYELHALATDAFKAANPIPSMGHEFQATPPNGALVQIGRDDSGAAFAHLYDCHGCWVVSGAHVDPPNQTYLHLRHGDKEFVKRAWEDRKGGLTWSAA